MVGSNRYRNKMSPCHDEEPFNRPEKSSISEFFNHFPCLYSLQGFTSDVVLTSVLSCFNHCACVQPVRSSDCLCLQPVLIPSLKVQMLSNLPFSAYTNPRQGKTSPVSLPAQILQYLDYFACFVHAFQENCPGDPEHQ